MKHFLIFGTHPRLSLAEYRSIRPNLEAPILVGSAAVTDDAEWDGDFLMEKLGGTTKLGDILMEIPVADFTAERVFEAIEYRCAEAIDFGFTTIGGSKAMQKRLAKLPLELKRILKSHDIKSRWVTSKEGTGLSPAAVAKLNLTHEGFDGVCIISKGIAYFGLTTNVQNADAWSERDYGRPARDDRAGMLPPKLARIMMNLARVDDDMTILDPFCGNGTVLMEAALVAHPKEMIGSDILDPQTASSEENLDWLVGREILREDDARRTKFFTADVKEIGEHLSKNSVDRIVTEGSLGPPLRGGESKQTIDRNEREISDLWISALSALAPIMKRGSLLVVIWPSFKTDGGIARVALDNEVENLGYSVINPLEGWDDSNGPLIYHRQGQHVARRIVVLRKK